MKKPTFVNSLERLKNSKGTLKSIEWAEKVWKWDLYLTWEIILGKKWNQVYFTKINTYDKNQKDLIEILLKEWIFYWLQKKFNWSQIDIFWTVLNVKDAIDKVWVLKQDLEFKDLSKYWYKKDEEEKSKNLFDLSEVQTSTDIFEVEPEKDKVEKPKRTLRVVHITI